MTSESLSAGGDARRLLADVSSYARRVRLAQRVTWLPLLALGVVTFGAILVYRFTRPVDLECQVIDGQQACRVFFRAAQVYWFAGLAAAYAVIAYGYLRVARARGLGARVMPYVLTGVGLLVVSAVGTAVMVAIGGRYFPEGPPPEVQAVLRVLDPGGMIGLALLVLAWLERRAALLVFALGYLVVVLTPVNFGWGEHWGDVWGMAPQLVINGGVLLLGSVGFAMAQRLRRPR